MINDFRGLSQQEPCTVLVVEDEPLVRLMVAEELRDSGMRVIEAGTADEAFERLRAGNPVDFVFADIELPGSMNGLELARRVQTDFPNLEFLMTSGRAPATKPVPRLIPRPRKLFSATSRPPQKGVAALDPR